VAIGIFSLFAPLMLGGGAPGQAAFILIGFVLLGLSYGQASGAVTANFLPHCYLGAALSADLAWLMARPSRRPWRCTCRPASGWWRSASTCCPARYAAGPASEQEAQGGRRGAGLTPTGQSNEERRAWARLS
jgi:hypothetical protein